MSVLLLNGKVLLTEILKLFHGAHTPQNALTLNEERGDCNTPSVTKNFFHFKCLIIPIDADAKVNSSLTMPLYEPQVISYASIHPEIGKAKPLDRLGFFFQKLITDNADATAG